MTAITPRSNPYVGPRAFEIGEPIFGRDRELRQLFQLIVARRIVLLHSPSGAGKTSLVKAGLIPKLGEDGFEVLPVTRLNLEPQETQGGNGLFNRYVSSLLQSLEENLSEDLKIPTEKLTHLSLTDYFTARHEDKDEGRLVVLVIDQAEDVLAIDPTDVDQKMVFFAQLGEVLRNPRLWMLFVIREDYLGALEPYVRAVPTRLANTYRLDLLGTEPACQAIQKPAQLAGADFTDEAAEILVGDLCKVRVQQPDGSFLDRPGPHVEPVQLQVVCYRLWEHLPSDVNQISIEQLAKVGDVDESLAEYYAEQVKATAQETGISERVIRRWFESKLITPDGLRGQVSMGENKSGELENRAIDLLVDAHLVRGEKRRGVTWFELAHDRLVTPVRRNNQDWFEQHLSLLQRQAELWNQQKRPDDLLLRGEALAEAIQWAEDNVDELTSEENDFLNECQELLQQELFEQESQRLQLELANKLAKEQQERAEIETQRANEQMETARRLKARNRIISILGVIAFFLMIIALIITYNAITQTRIARIRQLNSQVQVNMNKKSDLALLLGVEAYHLDKNSVDARNALLTALQQSPQLIVIQHNHEANVKSIAFQPESNTLISVDEKGEILTWDTSNLNQLTLQNKVEIDVPSLNGSALSPNGKILAFIDNDGSIKFWDLSNPQQPNPMKLQLADQFTSDNKLAFAPDEKIFASGDDKGNIQLWDLSDLNQPSPFGKVTIYSEKKVWSLAISPNREIMASGSENGIIQLWDLRDPRQPTPYGPQFLGHNGAVTALAISLDGRTLATGGVDETIHLWDVSKPGSPAEIGSPLTGHTGAVDSLAFSPDGRLLVSGGMDTALYIWAIRDIPRHAMIDQINGHTEAVRSLGFSPDGSTLVVGEADGSITLWDMGTPQLSSPIDTPLVSHSGGIQVVEYSPNGNILATGGIDQNIMLWDLSDPHKPIQYGPPLHGRESAVMSLAFSPDNQIMASGSVDGTIVLWDVSNPRQTIQLVQIGTYTNTINSLAFSINGKTLTSGSGDGTIVLWDVTNPKQPNQLGQPINDNGSAYRVAISRNSMFAAFGGEDGTIELWNLSDPLQPISYTTRIKGHEGFVTALAFSLDGKTLATGGADATIQLWDLGKPDSPAVIGSPLTGHTGAVYSIAFNPDGRSLVSGGRDETIRLWDINNPHQPSQFGPPLTGHTKGVISIGFSPDGNVLASGSSDQTIRLWGIDDQQQMISLSELKAGIGKLNSIVFSPDGKILASGSEKGILLLFDVSDPRQPSQISPEITSSESEVNSVSFSPDGKILASGNENGTILLWDVSNPHQPEQISNPPITHTAAVNSVTFSPDGGIMASGDEEGYIRIWSMGKPIQPNLLFESKKIVTVRSLAFSPGGDILASSYSGLGIMLWDVTIPQKPESIVSLGTGISDIYSLAFSSDGRILASGGGYDDGVIILWDIQNTRRPTLLGQINAHDSPVRSISFNPDAPILASGGADKSIRLWYMSADVWEKLACQRANRNMTKEEWAYYLDFKKYEKTCQQYQLDASTQVADISSTP